MIELPINQCNVEEIKYKLNDNKTVIFKFHNFIINDVEVIEKNKITVDDDPFVAKEYENSDINNCSDKNRTFLDAVKECSDKPKELHDYKPFSCLEKEVGMQEALEASRERKWANALIEQPTDKEILVENAIKDSKLGEKLKEAKELLKKFSNGCVNECNCRQKAKERFEKALEKEKKENGNV